MYGWRGRLGLIVSSSNATMEMELHDYLPEGVSLQTTRVPLGYVTEEELLRMNALAVEGARLLGDVELLLYGCTTCSIIGGKDYEKKLEMAIEEEVNVPVISTGTAVVEALKILDAREIIVVTPYTEEINAREREFLEANEFTVLDIRGLGFSEHGAIGRLEPYTAYRLAKASFTDEAEAIFISSTNWRTFEIIEALENDLGVPVVTSNQASLWLALREMDVMEKIPELGRLLTEY